MANKNEKDKFYISTKDEDLDFLKSIFSQPKDDFEHFCLFCNIT